MGKRRHELKKKGRNVSKGKRRYVAETSYRCRGESLQVVTVYPEEYNLDLVKKDIYPLTARKGVLRMNNNNKTWRFYKI